MTRREAAEALRECAPAPEDPQAALPPLDRARAVSGDIACAAAAQAAAEGLAEPCPPDETRRRVGARRGRRATARIGSGATPS